jgi:heme exporter protein A
MTISTSSHSQSTFAHLEARAITCFRGERELFKDLTLEVSAGECLHVRGQNGVGKTSLLRLLTGLSTPEAGDILWNGQAILHQPEQYHRQLLFLGHRDALKEDLTALENLQMYAAIDGVKLADDEIFSTLWRFGLQGREDLPVNCLSAGQKKRVLMARMLTRRAQLWILDEPFNALDVHAVVELQELIQEHLAHQGLVVMTSHQALTMPHVKVLDL